MEFAKRTLELVDVASREESLGFKVFVRLALRACPRLRVLLSLFDIFGQLLEGVGQLCRVARFHTRPRFDDVDDLVSERRQRGDFFVLLGLDVDLADLVLDLVLEKRVVDFRVEVQRCKVDPIEQLEPVFRQRFELGATMRGLANGKGASRPRASVW